MTPQRSFVLQVRGNRGKVKKYLTISYHLVLVSDHVASQESLKSNSSISHALVPLADHVHALELLNGDGSSCSPQELGIAEEKITNSTCNYVIECLGFFLIACVFSFFLVLSVTQYIYLLFCCVAVQQNDKLTETLQSFTGKCFHFP